MHERRNRVAAGAASAAEVVSREPAKAVRERRELSSGGLTTSLLQYRVNEQIKIREVRVIDEKGEQLGILAIQDALAMARDRGQDLVEVAPDARPPVCKLMDYGKFRYILKKKEHDAKKKTHTVQLKEIRVRPKIDKHDAELKVNQARGFLKEGHKVQINMQFRGRELAHTEVGREVMDRIVGELADVAKIERPAKFEGKRMTVLLTHK